MAYLLKENAADEVISRLTAKEDLVDIMIDIESYLDNSNLYVYDNWMKGELVSGPYVRRYWIDVTFKYALHEMPDPQGGLRLTPHGTKVSYCKAHELVDQPIETPSDYEPGTRKPRFKKEPVWLVHMKIPRRFIETLGQDVLDTYADEMEAEQDENTANTDANAQGGNQAAVVPALGGLPT
jgi:hypothetical protein